MPTAALARVVPAAGLDALALPLGPHVPKPQRKLLVTQIRREHVVRAVTTRERCVALGTHGDEAVMLLAEQLVALSRRHQTFRLGEKPRLAAIHVGLHRVRLAIGDGRLQHCCTDLCSDLRRSDAKKGYRILAAGGMADDSKRLCLAASVDGCEQLGELLGVAGQREQPCPYDELRTGCTSASRTCRAPPPCFRRMRTRGDRRSSRQRRREHLSASALLGLNGNGAGQTGS